MAVKLLQVLVLGVIAAADGALLYFVLCYSHVLAREMFTAEDACASLVCLHRVKHRPNLQPTLTRRSSKCSYSSGDAAATTTTTPHDLPVTWMPSRGSLPCLVPVADRISARRPPPPLVLGKKPKLGAGHFFWRRDNEELKSSNITISSNGTLELSKRKGKEGVYQCYTTISRGRVLGCPVNLKFAYLEKQFSVQPSNSTAWRGQPHALTCDISSGPPASFSWLRDGLPLPEDRRYILLRNQLLITEVTDEDAGIYKCKATNFLANKSRTSHDARLVVEASPRDVEVGFLPLAVENIIAAPKDSRVVLACPLVGDIKPEIIWEMTVPGESPGELEFVEETLVLDSLEQAGVYSCRVDGRSDLTKTFNVTVTEAVAITHGPKSRQEVLASTVRFNCTATGRPQPSVTWFKDGKELQLTDRINVVISADDMKVPQLLVRGVTAKDAGVYQCFAHNPVSVASAWAKLDVIGEEAEAPAALRCWPVDADHVYLEWSASVGNHDVIAYTVQHNIFNDGTSFPGQPLLNTSTSIKVNLPLTPYRFQVRVYIRTKNDQNITLSATASDISKTVTCQGQGVPISLVKIRDDAVLVSWQQFFEKNPGVEEWILQYMVENSTDEYHHEHNVTLKGNVYNYTLKVSPDQPVQVRVLGSRSPLWSPQDLAMVPWSSSAGAPGPRQPGEVIPTPYNVEVEELYPHNFTVRWMCRNPKKYQYLVCVNDVLEDSPDCWESYLTTLKISHLEPATNYKVQVQAKLLGKAVGGEFSAPLLITTPLEDEPEYSYIGDGIEVRWQGTGPRSVVYTQNVTNSLDTWITINTTNENHIQIPILDPKLQTFLMVSGSGPRRVITIPPPPEKTSYIYTYIGFGVAVILLCLAIVAAVCIWHRRKTRARMRTRSPIEGSEVITELRNVGGRLANGGTSRGAGEPLLNGHVHIIENPSQSKTPNGKIRKGRHDAPSFDVARYNDADITIETVLDDTTNTINLLDTSRRPEYDRLRDISPDSSFNKLPDDNMNSELNRSTFELDNSKIHPTLQPNG